MATTRNYLPLSDHLNIYDSDQNRLDAQTYPTNWQALNATVRVTDNPEAIMDIDYLSLEVMPTNPTRVTLYINDVTVPEFMMAREMIFHCQVKSPVDIDTTTALFETGQPMGLLVANTKKTTRDQFVTIRSNIWPLFKNEGTKTATVEINFDNHGGNIIYISIPAIINHFDFYRNSVVRSSRNYIPDSYWRLDFEQSDPQFPMYKLLDALTNTSNDVMQLFSNWFDHELEELAPGLTGTETWATSTLTDPGMAGDGNMDWLAQFTGAGLKGNIVGTDEPAGTARDFYTTAADIETFLQWQLENSYYGRGSGTREAMMAAAAQVLSGTKGVAIIPHYGAHAWKIQVQTLRSETQDFNAGTFSSNDVLDAVALAAPMGYEIFHAAVLFFAFTLGNVGLGRLGLGVLGGPGGYVPPDAPTGLTISAGGTPSTELTLTWLAPTYDGGDLVSAYMIRRDGSIIVANTGNTNVTHTDTGLSPGTAYSYTVSAINQAGAGDQSNSASGTTDPVVADAPTSLTSAGGATPSSMIDLSWTAPAYTGGAAIVGYQITENRAGAGDVVIVSNTGSNATTYTRTGLDRVTSYTYKVAAINSAGIGANSNTTTLTTAAELPDVPTGLTLTAGSPANTVISLAWTAPSNNGGAAISGYQIKKNGSIVVADTGGTATTYSATGLTHDTNYTFNVAAINSAGAGDDSTTENRDTVPNGIGATGGTITSYGDYRVHTFLTDGTFEITSNLNSSTFEVLLVGGGGPGGSTLVSSAALNSTGSAGGGGGGGVRAETGQTGTVATYAVVVGEGGPVGGNGENTEFGSLDLAGSGYGAGSRGADATGSGGGNPSNGSGGGGGGGYIKASGDTSGSGGDGGQTYNYGGDGGNGFASGSGGHWTAGGGGGGAYGNDGTNGSGSAGGNGGAGQANDFQTGSTQYYGGGGAGGFCVDGNHGYSSPGTAGVGGTGGGGDGGVTHEIVTPPGGSMVIKNTPTAGEDGRGGGGGASGWSMLGLPSQQAGMPGGDGIVVVRYSTL